MSDLPGVNPQHLDVRAMCIEISMAYQRMVNDAIFVGMATNQDVCVSSDYPMTIEMVPLDAKPEMEGVRPYIRYEVAARNVQ
jgi:hypothetical protein